MMSRFSHSIIKGGGHLEEIRFKQFQYFIQCYLVMAENYSEVIKLSREFKETEHQQYIDKLLAEVTEIKQIEPWDIVQEYVLEYGMRNCNIDQAQYLIEQILLGLEN